MDSDKSEFEQALTKVNSVFNEFTSFYSSLLEKGIDETEYGKALSEISQVFKEIYVTSKKNYDALVFNRSQFDEGRLERDAYERSLTRIEEFIIGAEFDIGLKVLPQLRRFEKELLQKQIVNKIAEIDLTPQIKTEIKHESEGIMESMANTEKMGNIDKLEKYINFGKRIVDLGQKVWKFVEKTAPTALPLILRIFSLA